MRTVQYGKPESKDLGLISTILAIFIA